MVAHFEKIVECLNDLVFEIDTSGHFKYANGRMRELSGYGSEELAQLKYWKLIHPRWFKKIVSGYNHQIKVGREESYLEFPIVNKKGEMVWLGLQLKIELDDSGLPTYVLGIGHNISERMELRNELSKKESLIFEVQGIAQIGTWELDIVNEKVSWSAQTFQIHEVDSKKEPSFEDAISFYDEASRPIITEAVRKAVSKGDPFDLKLAITTAKSNKKWVRVVGLPIASSSADRIAKLYGLFQDITKEKELESSLKFQNSRLAEARDRTQALAEAKDAFFSSVSHELRTPLNIVTSVANILLSDPHLPEQEEYLHALSLSSHNLLALINDILDLRKIEEGELEINIQPINIHHLLSDLKSSLQIKADEKELSLILRSPLEIPENLCIDKMRINQILYNLVGNALKFTTSGTISINANLLSLTATHACIRFSVSDTGIGINEDGKAKIFDRFTQASASIGEQYGGAGLGLNISNGLLKLMGSKLNVESTVGEGSEFWFDLKAGLPANNQVMELEAKRDKTTTGEKFLSGYTILAADDNALNLMVLKKQLSLWGCETITATNGKEAVEMAIKRHTDLVLMDVQMPIMNGFDAGSTIKKFKPELPIVALTAGTLSDISDSMREDCFDHVLPKPIDQEKMVGLLTMLLKNNSEKGGNNPSKAKPGGVKNGVSFVRYRALADGDNEFLMELMTSTLKQLVYLQDDLQRNSIDFSKKSMLSAAHRISPTLELLGAYDLKNVIVNIANSTSKENADKISEALILLNTIYHTVDLEIKKNKKNELHNRR